MSHEMETPLGRVRGLGPAGHGGGHWWEMRLNSIALLFLAIWLAVSLLRLPDLGHASLTEWLRDPLAAVPMLLLVGTAFWHIEKGMKELIDDYVHEPGMHAFSLTLLAFFVWGAGAYAAFSVLKIALGGVGAA